MKFVCVRCRREVEYEKVGSITGILHNGVAWIYCKDCFNAPAGNRTRV
ncbi:MAG: hypothetical protein NZ895_00835 [Archaeoglobaceae archaeon]|nr:hypothetical protein [Archaeoglobaceae archaeon]MCX8151964.1 hypothetical protein [Archaeoglobaceae archaeon]MDW8013353.1 hypothetical protein [Archaeoglobaceae archaeon]